MWGVSREGEGVMAFATYSTYIHDYESSAPYLLRCDAAPACSTAATDTPACLLLLLLLLCNVPVISNNGVKLQHGCTDAAVVPWCILAPRTRRLGVRYLVLVYASRYIVLRVSYKVLAHTKESTRYYEYSFNASYHIIRVFTCTCVHHLGQGTRM